MMILTAMVYLNRTRLQLIGHVNPLKVQSNPEQARVEMKCQRTDPGSQGKVRRSQEQTVTQLNILYESRQRSGQPGSDRDTEQSHAPWDRSRRKTRSTKDTKYKDLICE